MAVSNIRADFHAELQKVWEIVTSLEDTAWRSDLNNMHGHWTGIFSSKGNVTTIDFTEDVTAKNGL